MESAPVKASPHWNAGTFLLLAVFFGLVVARRWQQLESPQVWCEDGRLVGSFAEHGWSRTFEAVNGYLILVPRLITGVSLLVSSYHYPLISTLLACVFAALVGVAVAVSPTSLRGKFLCAASIFLVPSDTEVFGLPLYTLWWAPVLLLVVALWDERYTGVFLRILCVVAGGLSSPYVLVVLPVLGYRAIRFRKMRSEVAVALAATAVAAIQGCFIFGGAQMASPPLASLATYVVPRFCGWFLIGNFSDDGRFLWPAGILVIAMIVGFLFSNRHDTWAWILIYLYLGSIASSIIRVDAAALQPIRGGPRYFFFPFFLTSWILIQSALTARRKWMRVAAGTAALAGVLNAIPQWTRHHDDLHWKEHLLSAHLFPSYQVPIQYDGNWFRAWTLTLPGATWERLLRSDRLMSRANEDARPTFAYRVVGADELAADGWDSGGSRESGRIVSIMAAGAKKETLIILSAGRRIRYRSGPSRDAPSMEVAGFEKMFIPWLPMTTDWVTLEFSNSRLPQKFTVRVTDHGNGVGEWEAAAAE
jgi:hypothetical protein